MVVDFFHDQVSTKECFAARMDRTRDRPHIRRTRIRRATAPGADVVFPSLKILGQNGTRAAIVSFKVD